MEALLNEWLMREEFWLPPGVRWKDIEMTEDEGRFPLPRDLIYTLPLAFAFIALRYVFERWETAASHHSWIMKSQVQDLPFSSLSGPMTSAMFDSLEQ